MFLLKEFILAFDVEDNSSKNFYVCLKEISSMSILANLAENLLIT